MPIPKLMAGDVILSRSQTWLSRKIRLFEKWRSGGSRFSHALLALGELTEKPEVIEALWKVTRNSLEKYSDQEIVIYRKKNLTQGQRNEIALKCVSVERSTYGIMKIPLLALDAMFRTYWFSQHLGFSNFKVCSELIAWAYDEVLNESVFGCNWRSVSPDVIDDYCIQTQEWEMIFSQSTN